MSSACMLSIRSRVKKSPLARATRPYASAYRAGTITRRPEILTSASDWGAKSNGTWIVRSCWPLTSTISSLASKPSRRTRRRYSPSATAANAKAPMLSLRVVRAPGNSATSASGTARVLSPRACVRPMMRARGDGCAPRLCARMSTPPKRIAIDRIRASERRGINRWLIHVQLGTTLPPPANAQPASETAPFARSTPSASYRRPKTA